MKQKVLILLLMLFSFAAFGQKTAWINRLEFQLSSSFSQADNNLRGVVRTFDGPKYQTSINYAFGWNTFIRVKKNFFLESGLLFVRRKSKNPDIYDSCFHVNLEEIGCGGPSTVLLDRRHHLISIPVQIRIEKQLTRKLMGYWLGGMNHYFNLFTVHKSSRFKNKEKYKNYHGYSINTAIGIRYPITEKWNVDMEINSRLLEKYRQEEILGGDPDSYDTFYFNNINLMLSLNYYF